MIEYLEPIMNRYETGVIRNIQIIREIFFLELLRMAMS